MYDEATIQKFWSRVQRGEGCWRYKAKEKEPRDPDAYRYFFVDGVGAVVSHRVAYELTYGPVPDGLLVRHRCAVRACCRPDHLLVGTYEENTWDTQVRVVKNVPPGVLATYEDYPDWRPRRLR